MLSAQAASKGECLLTTVMSSQLEPSLLPPGPLTSPLMSGGGPVSINDTEAFHQDRVSGIFQHKFLDLSQ